MNLAKSGALESLGPAYVDRQNSSENFEMFLGGDRPACGVNVDGGPPQSANRRRLIGCVFEVCFIYGRFALEDTVNSFRRDVAMFVVVEQCGRILPIKNHDVD